MNKFSFIFLSLLAFTALPSFAKKLDGYIVTLAGDTAQCKIVQDIFVIQGIDISRFQHQIVTINSENKRKVYKPEELREFGIYTEDDTLRFRPVKMNVLFSKKKMSVFMKVADEGKVELFLYVEVSPYTGPGIRIGGNSRYSRYMIRKKGSEEVQWLEKIKGDEGKTSYKNFFKEYFLEDFEFFESLPENADERETIQRIRDYNKLSS